MKLTTYQKSVCPTWSDPAQNEQQLVTLRELRRFPFEHVLNQIQKLTKSGKITEILQTLRKSGRI